MARILVVDDDDGLRGLLVEMLEDEGHSVMAAADGTAALRLARETLPDLVLCDVVMSGLDGFGVLAALRKDPITTTIPVILVTGVGEPGVMRKGMEQGADDYLMKPVNQPALIRAVEARLARQAEARLEIQRRLDSLKASLVESLPHEFLTPLTALMGLASLLKDDGDTLEPQIVREVGDGIHTAAQRLCEITTKLNLYTQLVTAGSAAASGPRVENAAKLLEEVARGKAMRLGRGADLEVSAEAIAVVLPERHLTPLVEELVENALVFSAPGSAVRVAGHPEAGGWFVLTVADRGRGMTAEQLQGLTSYEPARRHDQQPGMGLGLANVRRLVQLYGGGIAFESVPDQGTTVRVRFPGA
jgi:two-component system, sensor histidine kinase and response regulator